MESYVEFWVVMSFPGEKIQKHYVILSKSDNPFTSRILNEPRVLSTNTGKITI